MPDEVFDLSDIDISTMGLVRAGAVSATDSAKDRGVNFLLIKSEEANMPDELNIEKVEDGGGQAATTFPDEPPQTWLSKIGESVADAVKGILSGGPEGGKETDTSKSKPDPKALAMAVKVLQNGGYDVTAAKLSRAMAPPFGGGGGEEEDEEEEPMKGKTKKSNEEPVAKGLPDAAIAGIVKAEIEAVRSEYATVLDEVRKSNETLQTENEALRKDIDSLRDDNDLEKAARRKTEAIQKAQTLLRLPVAVTDLADLLVKAEDSLDKEDFAKLDALLGAADRQLYQAGIFGEMGTVRSPEQVTIEEAVAKAAQAEGSNPEDALLNLPQDKQALLQKEWDEQSRSGGER